MTYIYKKWTADNTCYKFAWNILNMGQMYHTYYQFIILLAVSNCMCVDLYILIYMYIVYFTLIIQSKQGINKCMTEPGWFGQLRNHVYNYVI